MEFDQHLLVLLLPQQGAKAPGAASHGSGACLSFSDEDTVERLETGTPPSALTIMAFGSRTEALEGWRNVPPNPGLTAFVTKGVSHADAGDRIPTGEPAPATESAGAAAYMLIQGTVWAEPPIAAYRDIIMPMLAERGAYYVVYAGAEDVTVLQGRWDWKFVAISRWPDLSAARGFWFSDRYQTIAIPTRTGAGTFHVHLAPGLLP